MPRANPILASFTGGELSPRLYGRVDTAKYANAGKTVENFIAMPHGGIRKRPGSKFIWYARVDGDNQRLQAFNYSDDQSYMLLFSNLRIRIFTSNGIVTQTAQNITGITKANPGVVTYSGSDTYANGDRVAIAGVGGMTEVNNREFIVAGVDTGANTFQLTNRAGANVNTTGYTTYTSGGTVAEIIDIVTTYTTSEIDELEFVQSANTLFITHRNHAPAQLTRTSDTAWTLADLSILRGPWRPLNNDETITIKADDVNGNVDLTSSASLFNTLHVGAKFKLYAPSRANGESVFGTDTGVNNNEFWSYNGNVYEITAQSGGAVNSTNLTPPTHKEGALTLYYGGTAGYATEATFRHQGHGIVTVSSFSSSTNVDADVYSGFGYNQIPQQLAEGSARYVRPTKFWQEGAWSAYRGYPAVCTLFEQRFWAASTDTDPQTVYASVSGVYNDFEEGAGDDNALNYTIGSEQVDVIRWMNPGEALIIGTTSGEYVLSSSNQNDAVTPSNIKIKRHTAYGSSPMRPVRVGNAVIFGQRNGAIDNPARKIREMSYNFDLNAYISVDLTIWSDHITGEGVTGCAYQAQPDNLIWYVRDDGRLACCTYERDQEVVAWHKHYLGGYSNVGHTAIAQVEQIATKPGTDGDEVWMVVKRYINGDVRRYVERLTHFDDYVEKEDGIFLDCAITYDSTAATVITGLFHLEGEAVYVLADGQKAGPYTVTLGKITLDTAASVVQIGYPYQSTLNSMDIEAGAAAGTAQGKAKRIARIVLRLHRSLGGRFGPDEDNMDDILYRTPSGETDASPDLKTGDIPDREMTMPSGWDDKAEIRIEHDDPYPFTLLAIMPEMSASG